MTIGPGQPDWQDRLITPRLGLAARPPRPAEVGRALCDMMLARANLLEDADFRKIVPNQFIVELSLENYARNYAALATEVCEQWRQRLLQNLTTANSRQGRREYRFAGQVMVVVRPAADLALGQFRIRARVQPDAPDNIAGNALPACLELLGDGQRWPLRTGFIVLGREPGCDIVFDQPRVQELRLISGRHAYLHCGPDGCRLFDGTPQGLPSINGTFVNGRPVPATGQILQMATS